MTEWPIMTEGMPSTEGSVLAHRLVPQYAPETRFDPVWAALAGAAAVPAGLAAAVLGNVGLGAATALGGLLTAAGTMRQEKKLAGPKPLWKEFENWEVLTSLLAKSPNKAEAKHLFLGTVYGLPYDVPVLLSLQLLQHHLLCLGASGASKTQRLVMPIILQLLRWRDCSILFLDCKSDRASANMLRKFAKKFELPFYFFSLNPRVPSRLYCLFRDPAWRALQPDEQGQVLTRTFATEQSETGSDGYWSAKNREPLTEILTHYPDVASYREIHRKLSDLDVRRRLGMSKKDFEAASHLMSCLKDRGRIPQADPVPAEGLAPSYFDNAICFERALTEPCVIYLDLPAKLNHVGCRYIAREAMYLTTTRARTLPRTGRPHLYIVGEEAPTFLQSSLGTLLKQARDTAVSFLFTFQNASDMKLRDQDLRELLLTNTAVKVAFSAKDLSTRDYFERLSGERRETLGAHTTSATEAPSGRIEGTAHQQREIVVPRIGAAEFELVNAHHDLALFDASPVDAFTRFKHPVVVRLPFPISAEEYARYDNMPVREPVPGVTIRGIDIRRPAPSPPAPAPAPAAPPTPPETPEPPKPAAKKHRGKPPTPEQAERAAKAAEYLRRLAEES